jgi:hypothetical protein
MEGPNMRSSGRTRHVRRELALRKQIVQIPLAPPPKPCPKTTIERRIGYSSRPPKWKVWHHALTKMASEELIVAPRRDLFQPGRRALRGTKCSPPF